MKFNTAAWRMTCKILVGVGVVMMVMVLGVLLTFSSAGLELPHVEVGALPPAFSPAEMSISALPTGSYEGRAALVFRGGSWNDIRHLSTTALLVRHPKGNLLIDAGMGSNVDRHIELLPSMQVTPHIKGEPAVAQLAANGLRPSDLAGVIPTHAHWDHVSGIDDLEGVPVMESAAGKAFIETRRPDTAVMNSFARVNYKIYDFEGGSYLGFSKSHDVWGDGSIVIVPAPGHTPDSIVVFLTLPSQTRYAIIGDLVFQMEGLDLPAEKPWLMRRLIGEYDKAALEGIALVRAAGKKYAIHPIPAHDAAAFRAIPVFPASAR